ncbi:hypothetical protein EMCRGX_G011578 [Ephydatia muelleri]
MCYLAPQSLQFIKDELFPAAMLVEDRSVAKDLLAEADAMIYDLQNQLIFVRQELTEAHETLASQYCNKGGTTDIDNSDSTEANLRVLYPLDRFGIAKNPAVFASGKKKIKIRISGDGAKFSRTSNFILLSYAILEPSIGQYLSGLADSFVNVNGNPYPIELFLSSDMKDGWTPLMEASSGGHVTRVQLLVDRGAQINHQDKASTTTKKPFLRGMVPQTSGVVVGARPTLRHKKGRAPFDHEGAINGSNCAISLAQ